MNTAQGAIIAASHEQEANENEQRANNNKFVNVSIVIICGETALRFFVHKPSTLPLVLLNKGRKRTPSTLTRKPEHNGRIGGSRGMSDWLAMLAFLRLPHLR